MKKILSIAVAIAAIFAIASCGGDDKKSGVEKKAVEMFKQMYQAGENNDLEEFTELAEEFDEWLNGLSEKDQKAAEKAVMDWDEEKAEQVIDAANVVLGY